MRFLGEKLKFGERASFKNVPVGTDEDEIWDEKLFFNIEMETIKNYIRQKIEDYLVNTKKAYKDSLWKKIEAEIKEHYVMSPDTELIERIKNREFAKIIPSKKKIYAWWFLFFFAVIAETFILLLQSMFGGGGFNPVILIFGFLLGLGGFFLGEAIGDIMFYNEFAKLGQITKEHKLNTVKLGFFTITGILLISFIAIVRSFGAETFREKFVVIGLTVLLGLAVALIEGHRKKLSELREYVLIEQERGLRHMASKLHSNALKSVYKNFFEEVWKEIRTKQGKEVKEELKESKKSEDIEKKDDLKEGANEEVNVNPNVSNT